ncbi:cinnamoyl-CoA reductase [Penicillium riverlandense]|uniref:cinnamoyl-CoA reductase n=1 Tax=Penicillium riverlandense TaxID=1903569 RepID=UPI002549B7B3|nr:cinnamoyl-CoA reductase [Penicillium riverlandense]KAJ5808761.1 cinnamoyl-CoA reductase [Penicillium riverlandense]
MAPRILLTGATGLIGFRILQELLKGEYEVRITVRSETKAQEVLFNPVIQKIKPGNRLTYTIVPDSVLSQAFDTALQDVTSIIHAGSPVPVPGFDPVNQIWKPIVEGTANLLTSALKFPRIKRVLITSSIVANMAPMPDPSVTVTANSRVQLPGIPQTFSNVFEAYVLAKITEINNVDSFVEQQKPHFSVATIIPGYVYGRDELVLDSDTAVSKGSSSGILLRSLTGTDLPAPIHGGYVHIDDLAQVYMKVLELQPEADTPSSFGACSLVSYDDAWRLTEKNFPNEVSAGRLKQGTLRTLPISYDSSETNYYLNIKFRPFEDAVKDIVQLYLDRLDMKEE